MKTHPFFSNRKVVILLASLSCVLWGSAYPAIKSGYLLFAIERSDVASQMLFSGYRMTFAGLLLLIFALFCGRAIFRLQWRNVWDIVSLGCFQTTLQYAIFYTGVANTTGVKSSVLNATSTFFSVLIAHFIYQNDRLSLRKSAGCLLGFAGVMVVNFHASLLDFHVTLTGEGFVVLAAFVFSAATIYGRGISQRMDSVVLSGYQLMVGGLVLVLLGHLSGGHLSGFTPKSTALFVYMILLSSVAFSLWTTLLKYNRVGMVTIFNFLIPVSGVFLSAIFLGESILEWKNVAALALVCSGIWLVTKEA